MDYSKLSDFEINGMVASLTQSPGDHTQTSNETFIHEYADIGEIKGLCLGWKKFDPCNNPADAWPIILSKRIGVVPGTASDKWAAHYCNWDIAIADTNPLRAAMIVFLMTQESQDA
ncbi:phage protein NinX family protein [Cronobacter sakazakii]|uniref:phage protein NinX family protein n=1 Tax=Cronobacter sakazakii TaxID=28141 RepID=UPI002ACE247B|nr:phage protein NinX family protein [Cronobacter sakazakii]MDZ7554486.1 phage protein NinX family protein [Cronobacter sakazakii]